MDNAEDQIFGLIEAAEQQQAAVTAALARLAKVTEDFKTSSTAAVSAIEGTTHDAVTSGMRRASERAFDIVAEALNPLYAALRDVAATADKATKSYSDSASSIHFRWVAVAGGMAACCIVAVLVTGWISLTWQRNQVGNLKEEKAALLVEVADLKTTADKLVAKGGRAALTTCGTEGQKGGRLCVRVDAGPGVYGDKNTGQFYVVHGY